MGKKQVMQFDRRDLAVLTIECSGITQKGRPSVTCRGRCGLPFAIRQLLFAIRQLPTHTRSFPIRTRAVRSHTGRCLAERRWARNLIDPNERQREC
jgi:hypothetical protein